MMLDLKYSCFMFLLCGCLVLERCLKIFYLLWCSILRCRANKFLISKYLLLFRERKFVLVFVDIEFYNIIIVEVR